MITWDLQGSQQLLLTVDQRLSRFRDPQPLLQLIGVMVRDAFVQRLRQGLPGWAPLAASTIAQKGSSRAGIDTGTMLASIAYVVDTGSVTIGISGPAGDKNGVENYARWFQQGTGIYAGHSPWRIVPVRARALSWIGAGGVRYFARSVIARGQPPRPFIFFDQPLIQRIVQLVAAYYRGGESPQEAA